MVARAPGEAGAFFVPLGRNGIRVNVKPVGTDNAVIDAYSWIGRGLEITPELAMFLAERNSQLRFGALGIDPEGDVMYQHSLFPESISKVVLERLVQLMAMTADELDDELNGRFGTLS